MWAFSGAEGASFLEIPVGARPAALGSAYSALANDAYAPVWNPAGLGFLDSTQVAGMHQIYVEDTTFEYLSVVHPFKPGSALGISAQYFRPGSVDATDITGNSLGTFSGYYGAYSLSYGQELTERVALGLTGKLISAKIDDVSANAFAGDAGVFFRPSKKLSLAGVVANLGQKLRFLQQDDSLPVAYKVGAAYQLNANWLLAGEGAMRKYGPSSFHGGVEWSAWQPDEDAGFALRGGYNSERTRNLSKLAGLAIGFGAFFWEHEVSYTWMPLGDFGQAHYMSLVLRFGGKKHGHVMKSDEASARYEHLNDLPEDAATPHLLNESFKDERSDLSNSLNK